QTRRAMPRTKNPVGYLSVTGANSANAAGPDTTPPNVMKPDAPVMAPASPGGARRAISDNCTPFQPIPVAPKHAATRSKAASGQPGLKPTVANANPAEATPITPSRRRGGSQ